MAGFVFGNNLFSTRWYGTSLLAGITWFMPFFSTYGVIQQQKFVLLV
jgi:hypothetical protein